MVPRELIVTSFWLLPKSTGRAGLALNVFLMWAALGLSILLPTIARGSIGFDDGSPRGAPWTPPGAVIGTVPANHALGAAVSFYVTQVLLGKVEEYPVIGCDHRGPRIVNDSLPHGRSIVFLASPREIGSNSRGTTFVTG